MQLGNPNTEICEKSENEMKDEKGDGKLVDSLDSSDDNFVRAKAFMGALKQNQEKKEQTAKKVKALQDAASDTEFSYD
jgi:hypothetical protein